MCVCLSVHECTHNHLRCLKYHCTSRNEHNRMSESLKYFCFKNMEPFVPLLIPSSPCPQTIQLRSLCCCGQWWPSSLFPSLVPRWWTCPLRPSQSCFYCYQGAFHLTTPNKWQFFHYFNSCKVWKTNNHRLVADSLPVSPNSPKILMNTSASVPLDFMSAV